MNKKIDRDLLENIKIPEGMKEELYKNCRKGRRTKDLTFRYSGALAACIGIVVFGLFSIGVSAAYLSVRDRLEGMSPEEQEDYRAEVENDHFVSTDEGESRELREDEIRRIIELERAYYDEGVFPSEEMAHLETRAELRDGQLAYVTEDNLVWLPEEDMSDEQLLQYIDHNAKKRYINVEQLISEGIEPGVNMALESTPIAEGSGESRAREAGDGLLKELYGLTLDDSWIVLVSFLEEETEEGMEEPAEYVLDYFRKGVGFATGYRIVLRADDLNPVMICRSGYEEELKRTPLSIGEASALAEEGEIEARRILSQYTDLEQPKALVADAETWSDDGETTYYISYEFERDGIEVGLTLMIDDWSLQALTLRQEQ